MSTERQTLWQELQDPGVNPKLDQMIQLLSRIADNLAVTDITNPTAVSTTRGASSTGANGTAGSRLVTLLPRGTIFTLPQTLQTFNELIGAAGISGAQPIDVTQSETIAPYDVGPITYPVPKGKYAIAIAAFDGVFTRHSPGITVNGFLNYGLPDALPITQPNLPATEDFHINRLVTGSHELTDNLTVLVANNTPLAVSVTLTTVFILVDISRWDTTYVPIFREAVRAWIDAMAADAQAIGAQTT